MIKKRPIPSRTGTGELRVICMMSTTKDVWQSTAKKSDLSETLLNSTRWYGMVGEDISTNTSIRHQNKPQLPFYFLTW